VKFELRDAPDPAAGPALTSTNPRPGRSRRPARLARRPSTPGQRRPQGTASQAGPAHAVGERPDRRYVPRGPTDRFRPLGALSLRVGNPARDPTAQRLSAYPGALACRNRSQQLSPRQRHGVQSMSFTLSGANLMFCVSPRRFAQAHARVPASLRDRFNRKRAVRGHAARVL